jgi:excisionase family DNA binding protein
MMAITYTIEGTTKAIGLPRTTIYELIGSGKLVAKKAGRRTLITHESIQEYLDSLPMANIRSANAA